MGFICSYRTNPVSISTDKQTLVLKLLFNCVITKFKSKQLINANIALNVLDCDLFKLESFYDVNTVNRYYLIRLIQQFD